MNILVMAELRENHFWGQEWKQIKAEQNKWAKVDF